MGPVVALEVFSVTGGMARYQLGENDARRIVRVFMRPKDEKNLTDDEVEPKRRFSEDSLSLNMLERLGTPSTHSKQPRKSSPFITETPR